MLVFGGLVGSLGRDGRAGQILLSCRIIIGWGGLTLRGAQTEGAEGTEHIASYR